MFKTKATRVIALLSLVIVATCLAMAFYLPAWSSLFIIATFMTVAVWMLLTQLIYTLHLYREDQRQTALMTKHCPICDARVYKSDEICPYCGAPCGNS